jgi:hypothetical protein
MPIAIVIIIHPLLNILVFLDMNPNRRAIGMKAIYPTVETADEPLALTLEPIPSCK